MTRGGYLVLFLLCISASVSAQETPPKPPLGLPPVPWPVENPYSAARVELGRYLFFDPRMSADGGISCATCHPPGHAFAGGDPAPVGVTGKPLARRAPTLINRAYGKSEFYDGRAPSLEEQMVGPVTNPDEMGTTKEAAEQAIAKISGYAPLFERAFGDSKVTYVRITQAIASFERTILSGNAPYDRFLSGDKQALSPAAKRGMQIFERTGECSECHKGPNFTDEKFASLGIDATLPKPDLGLALITGKSRDDGKFKVPTLREVAHTGPYMHDRRFKTLDEVLEFYRKGGIPGPHLDSRIASFFLDAPARADLRAFLESLSGEGWQQIQSPEKLP
jgi:cytochrome c peroxidase